VVPKADVLRAIEIYLREAYPGGAPAGAAQKLDAVRAMPGDVPDTFFEPAPGLAGNAMALRLGQPVYPHMKLVVEFCGTGACASGAMFRVDTHDKHLHAAPGSPDEAWLQQLRTSNKAVTEKIESAWMAAGIPTFKAFLRRQLEERKRKASEGQ
jgi:hypothetical protein